MGEGILATVGAGRTEYGRQQAQVLAGDLSVRPSVTMDTKERLFFQFPGVYETGLPQKSKEPQFRYRYRGLRLLAQSNGRVFLIPDQWAPGNGNCLMLPVDSDTRFQFRAG